MKKQGILFDLDGTLWEVIDATYESANEVIKKHNLKEISKEIVCSTFGLNRTDSAKSYFPYLGTEEAEEILDEISDVNIKRLKEYGGNVYKNVDETIKKLYENYDIFIVSNTGHSEYIKAFLTSSGLEKYFKDYLAASELKLSKSAAIKKVIKEYELEKYVYVGDTIKDLEASNEAKVPFIQAKYGFGKDLNTKYYINSIEELPNVIENVL